MTELSGWTNFYVIIGSAAGALIGLQFVVMTLIANSPIAGRDAQAGDAFATRSIPKQQPSRELLSLVSSRRPVALRE